MASGNARQLRDELRRARQSGRVQGAYLFEGAAGAGGVETASWFARLLLCRSDGPEPCESCRDCRKTSRDLDSHPDLQRIEPPGPAGTALKIDQIRELQRKLSLVANEGGWRVGLILGAERMRGAAANALLKTLEEPPRQTSILLVTSQPGVLPATVLSRTTRLRFAVENEAALRASLQAEGLDERAAWLATCVAGGSTRSALDWAGENLSEAEEYLEALEEMPAAPASRALDFAESFRGGGAVRGRVELLLAVHAALARREAEAAAREGRREDLARWLDRADAGERARGELARRNLNPQLLVEGLMLELQP